jgi:signal transduction histidine kinase
MIDTVKTQDHDPAPEAPGDAGTPVRPGGRDVVFGLNEEQSAQLRALTRTVLREPFTKRVWAELAYFVLASALVGVGFVLVGWTMFLGVVLAITFFGLAILVLSLRLARGFGGLHRGLCRSFLDEHVDDPEPFAHRPGFLGWMQSGLRDRVAWRAVAYLALRIGWTILGFFVAVSLWWDAFACLLSPLFNNGGGSIPVWGFASQIFPLGGFHGFHGFSDQPGSFLHEVGIFLVGIIFFFAAPWVMRGFVNVDRLLVRVLLGPDPVAARVRTLEQARTQTVDASAATLRRIERDLHDGTQAQLVALAMRLGMAKERLEDMTGAANEGDGEGSDTAVDPAELARVTALVVEAHRGAKEAIVELRDIARGIHPPALDVGLEGALATLAARSPVTTEVRVDLQTRPTPAIEAITYFCAAELLANVAQHANASRASLSCAQQGTWLRLVVRDDGRGGAQLSTTGSSSSGLAGLVDRVHAVDGRLNIVSPSGGPSVVTVDLPLGA